MDDCIPSTTLGRKESGETYFLRGTFVGTWTWKSAIGSCFCEGERGVLVLSIFVGVLTVLLLWIVPCIRVLKRKIQELAMQVSLLNQENERLRKRLDKVSK